MIDETFVLKVVNTLFPKWFKAVSTAAHDIRFTPAEQEGKVEAIKINTVLWNALCARPFKSG
jgi:hypothetical protein